MYRSQNSLRHAEYVQNNFESAELHFPPRHFFKRQKKPLGLGSAHLGGSACGWLLSRTTLPFVGSSFETGGKLGLRWKPPDQSRSGRTVMMISSGRVMTLSLGPRLTVRMMALLAPTTSSSLFLFSSRRKVPAFDSASRLVYKIELPIN